MNYHTPKEHRLLWKRARPYLVRRALKCVSTRGSHLYNRRARRVLANSLDARNHFMSQGASTRILGNISFDLTGQTDLQEQVNIQAVELRKTHKKTAVLMATLNDWHEQIAADIKKFTKLRDRIAAEFDGHSELNEKLTEKLAIILSAAVHLSDVNEVELKEALFPRVPGFKEHLMSVPLSEEDIEALSNDRNHGRGHSTT